MIYFYFLQSDWLQQRAAFYDILTAWSKRVIFSDKPRSEDNFQTQNTTQKIENSTLPILKIIKYSELTSNSTLPILKIVKCSELTSMNLVPSPKCTFLRPKCEKTNINIDKTLASATSFASNAPHIFSYSSKKYTYKYKYYNVQLLLKHKIL